MSSKRKVATPENNWITEQRVLAAYHTGQIDELKGEVKRYIDENETT